MTTSLPIPTPRATKWYVVPAGTRFSMCARPACRRTLYWIKNPRHSHGDMPISCDVDGGVAPAPKRKDPRQRSLFTEPTGLPRTGDGRGVIHNTTCVSAAEFWAKGRR